MAQDTPKWLRQAVIYEVFTRNHSIEGTFANVADDLERIRQLGADIVWLMPIHPISADGRKGTHGSPYAIRNYRAISPDLGDEASLKRLIDKTHALGLKIMLDVVYHHTGRDANLTQEHPEWYLHDGNGNLSRKCEEWADVYDLDYAHQPLWDYLIGSLEKWSQLGIDGFRCDVAPLVPVEFWLAARQRLNRDKEVLWLAESVHPAFVKFIRDHGYLAHSDAELHQAFDLTYDYDGRERLDLYFRGEAPLKAYLDYLYVQETAYPQHALKLRFAENHDQPRIASLISSPTGLQNWTAFYLLLPGAALIYAGQEFGLAALPNLFEKDPVPWERGDQNFLAFFEKMVACAKNIKAQCATFAISELATGVVQIVWSNAAETYTAILNLEDRSGKIKLARAIQGQDLFTGRPVQFTETILLQKEPLLIKTM